MQLSVLYFGMLRERFGPSAAFDLPASADVAALITLHRSLASDLAWPSIAVAVNREYAQLTTALHDGDEVALLPPVSGGSPISCHSERSEESASLIQDFVPEHCIV